jgi:hypothetical protein
VDDCEAAVGDSEALTRRNRCQKLYWAVVSRPLQDLMALAYQFFRLRQARSELLGLVLLRSCEGQQKAMDATRTQGTHFLCLTVFAWKDFSRTIHPFRRVPSVTK